MALPFLLPALVTGVGLVLTQEWWLPVLRNPPSSVFGDFFFAILLVSVFVGIFAQAAYSLADAGLPRREQRRYLAVSAQQPLTPTQQSLLSLDALSDFRAGLWNSSLAYHPTWVEMPETWRTKHEDGEKGQPFLMLSLGSLRWQREELDRNRRIIRDVDLEMFVADCFSERSWSGRLRHALNNEPDVIGRLAALTGAHELDLRALAHPQGSHLAPLLWAADVQRAIATVRTAYGAGVVDAETAWRLIAHAGAVAAAVFPDARAYEDNLRVGTALGTDNLEDVHAFDRARTDFRASAWPAVGAAFPLLTRDAIVPPAVLGQWPDQVPVPGAE